MGVSQQRIRISQRYIDGYLAPKPRVRSKKW
jgi:hypothetical protein